jgi:hypothetical protein
VAEADVKSVDQDLRCGVTNGTGVTYPVVEEVIAVRYRQLGRSGIPGVFGKVETRELSAKELGLPVSVCERSAENTVGDRKPTVQRGRWFEQFEIDTVFGHCPFRTVTETENTVGRECQVFGGSCWWWGL